MKGPVVLLGATGMLGRAMLDALAREDAEVSLVGRDTLDLSKPDSIALPQGASWVINCAAYTDVDGAEADGELADAINGHGLGLLAERCRDAGATLINFGTDYVFDGRGAVPYAVDHPVNPQNAYGRSKALGESLLFRSGARHLHVRTSWLYAPWGQSFVTTMARLTRERDELSIVADQRGRPTSARHLAAATLALASQGAEGIFHVTDGDECTWYELARAVAEHVRGGAEIKPCTSDDYPRPAPRPSYSVLDVSRAEAILGPMPPWRGAVAKALDDAQSSASTS